jgi:hypothetical protein
MYLFIGFWQFLANLDLLSPFTEVSFREGPEVKYELNLTSMGINLMSNESSN